MKLYQKIPATIVAAVLAAGTGCAHYLSPNKDDIQQDCRKGLTYCELTITGNAVGDSRCTDSERRGYGRNYKHSQLYFVLDSGVGSQNYTVNYYESDVLCDKMPVIKDGDWVCEHDTHLPHQQDRERWEAR